MLRTQAQAKLHVLLTVVNRRRKVKTGAIHPLTVFGDMGCDMSASYMRKARSCGSRTAWLLIIR